VIIFIFGFAKQIVLTAQKSKVFFFNLKRFGKPLDIQAKKGKVG
jgi:hypothetical protein